MSGKLIVFEGIDASGKTTQWKMLIQRLEKEGYSTAKFDFPRYDSFYGKLIGKYLRGEFKELNPYIASLLFALDRLEVKEEITNFLKGNMIVVINRYVASNKAFQAARLKNEREKYLLIKWIDEIEYSKNNLPREEIIIFLDATPDTADKLLEKKGYRDYMGNKEKDMHERDKEYLREVNSIYHELQIKNKNWVKINCVVNKRLLSPDEICEMVWEAVKDRLR